MPIESPWRTIGTFISVGFPADDNIKQAAAALFEGYTPEEIDKAMDIFHAFCETARATPELTDLHKSNLYHCAAIAYNDAVKVQQIQSM